MALHSTRARSLLSSGSLALSLALLLPSAAQADCVASGSTVTCTATDADGFTTTSSGFTVNVDTAAAVNGLVSTGATSTLNNAGAITVGSGNAVAMGNGSTVNNASTGAITGNSALASGTLTNFFNNAGTVTGNLTSDAPLNFNNMSTGTFGGNVTANNGATFLNDGTLNGNFTVSAGNTLFTNNGTLTGALSLGAGAATLTNSGTITGNITGTGNTSFTNSGTLTGDMILGAGNDSITNTGTFTGALTLGGGTNIVTISNASQLPTLGIIATAGTGATNTLVLSGAGTMGTTTFANFDILQKTGAGTWTLGAAWTLEDKVQVDAGTLSVGDAAFLGANKITNNGTVEFTNATTGTYSGVMSGTGAVTIGTGANTGITTFSGPNTYTGLTTIAAGTLRLTGGAAIADTAGITVNTGATLDVAAAETIGALTNNGAVTLGGNLTAASLAGSGTVALSTFNLTAGDATNTAFSGVISGTGSLVKTGAGTLTLSGVNTYTGATTVSAGTLSLTSGALAAGNNIVNNGTVSFTDSINSSFTGIISGSGGVTMAGTAELTLAGVNSYTGATTVSSGTLIATGTSITDTSAVTVAAGATLRNSTADETIGSLAGAGAVDAAGRTLTVGGNNSSTAFSGTFTATSSLTKAGTGTLTLTGTNTLANLTANAGTLAIGGTYTAAATNVGAAGTLDLVSGGALTSTVTGVAGSTIKINGTLTGNLSNAGTLSGAGTVIGTVTNSGTLRPGNSPGFFNVNGAFVQTSTGTLNAEITSNATAGTGYDQVRVTGIPGSATLAGTLAITPTAGGYVAGSTYDVVRASGGITGGFTTVTGTTLSPFLSLTSNGVVTLSGTDQVYRLTVTRGSYAAGIASAATANQTAVATGFQGLVAGATGDALVLIGSVDNMTVAQAQAFFDEASPEPYGAYATALVDQGDLFTRQVGLHLADATTRGAWVRLYGQGGEGDNRGFRFGTDHDLTGVAGGVDFVSNGTYHFGAALGYAEGPLKYELGNSDSDSKSWQAGVYGGYTAGAISANLQIAYVDASADVSRSVGSRFASADVDGNLWKIVGTVGYDMNAGGATVRPFVGIDYSNGKIKGFTETGANAAALTVSAIDADETDLMAGINLGGSIGGISPYGRLVYRYNLDGANRNIDAIFNGNTATAFTVSAAEPGKSQFDVDAGLRFSAGPAVGLHLGYQGTFRSDLNSHGVNAGIRFNF